MSAVEAHPEFYPDVIAAGGLTAALAQVAADLGMEIGAPVPDTSTSLADVRIAAPTPGRADLTITAGRHRRGFAVDNHEPGIAHAHGRTSDLAAVAKALAAWFAGADPRGMQAAAPFIAVPLMAEAHATGSAERVVEANWAARREAWGRIGEFEPDGWQEPAALTALRVLLDVAHADPRFRRLYAVTSHFTLWFSQCTDHPFAQVGAAIEPQNDGRYRVRHHMHRDESELFDSPYAAVARAGELLPADCGGAILGTASDLHAEPAAD